jgi:methionyl-tRNA synthetase
MCRECTFGADLSFSKDSLVAMHNADLCDTLGNLVHRAFSLMEKYRLALT